MAINRGGSVEDEEDEIDGKTLRRKFEATLAENRSLKAEKILSGGTYSLVTPEDLTKVDPDKIEETAKALQLERETASKSLIRDTFAKRGLEGDALDEAVENFLGTADDGAGAIDRVQDLSAGGGRPPLVNTKDLHGQKAIEAGLAANDKRRARRNS